MRGWKYRLYPDNRSYYIRLSTRCCLKLLSYLIPKTKEAQTTRAQIHPTMLKKGNSNEFNRVSDDPFGRSIKKVLEHLQMTKAYSSFGYSDLPPLDEEYVIESNMKVQMPSCEGQSCWGLMWKWRRAAF